LSAGEVNQISWKFQDGKMEELEWNRGSMRDVYAPADLYNEMIKTIGFMNYSGYIFHCSIQVHP
jgi:hypothetical protein